MGILLDLYRNFLDLCLLMSSYLFGDLPPCVPVWSLAISSPDDKMDARIDHRLDEEAKDSLQLLNISYQMTEGAKYLILLAL